MKTEFPEHWSDDKIIHYVSDIATDPTIKWVPDPRFPNRWRVDGVREGITIRVIIEDSSEGVITAFPRH